MVFLVHVKHFLGILFCILHELLEFQFPAFYPDIGTNNSIRHIRLDHVMEFLLGDKLK